MNFHDSVSFQLAKVTVAHKNALERAMSETGLHSGQVFILFELWNDDGLRQIDLASRLKIAPPTINKMLRGLIEKGFVRRTKVEDDARSTRIFLTESGAAIRPAVETQWVDLESEILAELTETERLILRELLSKLLKNQPDEDEEDI